MNKHITQQINQAVISFTFAGDNFNIDCQLGGIKPNTQLFNALEANQFIPVYDLDYNAFQFLALEYCQRDLPTWLNYQAC